MTQSDAKPAKPVPQQPEQSDDKTPREPVTTGLAEVESVAGEEDPGAALDSDDFLGVDDGSAVASPDAEADDDAPPDPDLEAAGRRSASHDR